MILDHTYGYRENRPGYKCSGHVFIEDQSHSGKRRAMLIQLMNEHGHGNHVRVEFNPVKDDMAVVREVVEYVTGHLWGDVLGWARITRVDMTVDILGIDINSISVSCKFAQKRLNVTTRKGVTGTIQFGTNKSEWKVLIYDKARQSKSTGKWLRVEVWYRPKPPKSFASLSEIDNPFLRLTVDSLIPLLMKEDLTEPELLVLHLARHEGINNALEKCRPETKVSVKKRLEKYLNNWFVPQDVWSKWSDVLQELKSPPPSAGFID